MKSNFNSFIWNNEKFAAHHFKAAREERESGTQMHFFFKFCENVLMVVVCVGEQPVQASNYR